MLSQAGPTLRLSDAAGPGPARRRHGGETVTGDWMGTFEVSLESFRRHFRSRLHLSPSLILGCDGAQDRDSDARAARRAQS